MRELLQAALREEMERQCCRSSRPSRTGEQSVLNSILKLVFLAITANLHLCLSRAPGKL